MRYTYKLLAENNTRKIASELRQGTTSYSGPKIPPNRLSTKAFIFPPKKGGGFDMAL